MIKCRVCNIEKKDEDFYLNCKVCGNKCKQCYADYYKKSKQNGTRKRWEEVNKEKIVQYKKEYFENNRKKLNSRQKQKFKNLTREQKDKKNVYNRDAEKKRCENPEYLEAKRKKRLEYREKNKEEINRKRRNRHKKKYAEDTAFKLEVLLKTGFYKAIKRKQGRKEKSIMKIIKCTQEYLIKYLENQFRPEMNWENHGDMWEIDHIIPIAAFDLANLEDQEKCFNYTNLQPLFKTTAIANSFGYNEIGNHNKKNFIINKE